jgi:biotin carboxyl carrier protein
VTLLVMFAPWPGAYRAPALVEYSPLAIVRPPTAGFVREIQVRIGQSVQPDQVLAVLENEMLAVEVEELRVRVRQARERVRAFRFDGQTAKAQAEEEELAALERRLAEKDEQLAGLVLRAPVAGTVVSQDLDSLRGTYLARGTEMLVIGSEDRKELILSIAQEDLDVYKRQPGQPLWVRIRGRAGFVTALSEISPRARREPPHDAFCAPLGGPLPVRLLDGEPKETSAESRYELLAPRFEGSVILDREKSLSLHAGQRGCVALRTSERSIADHVFSRLRHWFQTRSRDLPDLL